MSDYLKPFWRYYGGKWRAAPKYPQPKHNIIVEPFAGAGGYSLRYYQHRIILVEKYPVVAEIWRYLIGVKPAEILRIPLVDAINDLPSWVPEGGRYLVGFALNAATVSPCRVLSAGRKKMRESGRIFEGWSEQMRARVASQVDKIRHWTILEMGYEQLGDFNPEATWYVDPPYQLAGKYYVHSSKNIDYSHLAGWCRSRRGQTIVCENEGATWLPFKTFMSIRSSGMSGKGGYSHEVIYEQDRG